MRVIVERTAGFLELAQAAVEAACHSAASDACPEVVSRDAMEAAAAVAAREVATAQLMDSLSDTAS